jgi:hypothetical protein
MSEADLVRDFEQARRMGKFVTNVAYGGLALHGVWPEQMRMHGIGDGADLESRADREGGTVGRAPEAERQGAALLRPNGTTPRR